MPELVTNNTSTQDIWANIHVPGSINSYIGDGHPTLNRESLQWAYKLLRNWVDLPIPSYREQMGV